LILSYFSIKRLCIKVGVIMKIKIFTTGGSIDKYYSTQVSDFIVGDPQMAQILEDGNITVEYEIESLAQKDSLDITKEDRQRILERVNADPNHRILITHGTDTMIETAKSLSTIPDKVIVLTGAMQPAAFKRTDAAFNIGGAIIALQTLPEGVYIVMNGRIYDPLKTHKNLNLDRFEDT